MNHYATFNRLPSSRRRMILEDLGTANLRAGLRRLKALIKRDGFKGTLAEFILYLALDEGETLTDARLKAARRAGEIVANMKLHPSDARNAPELNDTLRNLIATAENEVEVETLNNAFYEGRDS